VDAPHRLGEPVKTRGTFARKCGFQTFVRDEFTLATKEIIAKRVGYLCSNPDCRCPTVGAAPVQKRIMNIGVAAHITAASPDGPRYDSSLTPEQRRDHSNGIWMCQTHGKLVDSDTEHFTIDMLRAWKREAEISWRLRVYCLLVSVDDRRRWLGTSNKSDF
jgi:hypothetical protein